MDVFLCINVQDTNCLLTFYRGKSFSGPVESIVGLRTSLRWTPQTHKVFIIKSTIRKLNRKYNHPSLFCCSTGTRHRSSRLPSGRDESQHGTAALLWVYRLVFDLERRCFFKSTINSCQVQRIWTSNVFNHVFTSLRSQTQVNLHFLMQNHIL